MLARTDKEAGNRGMSIFIVDLHAAGVERGPKEHKMGQRASQVGALTFTDVALPEDALLGEAGRGFHMMMSVLDKGRVGIAALAVGIAQAAWKLPSITPAPANSSANPSRTSRASSGF